MRECSFIDIEVTVMIVRGRPWYPNAQGHWEVEIREILSAQRLLAQRAPHYECRSARATIPWWLGSCWLHIVIGIVRSRCSRHLLHNRSIANMKSPSKGTSSCSQ
ncbi:hypothetical protein HRR83_001545 [Exophiala dermatitidis]|nr:hypothetical protein HRR73_004679 [Exophiala dermatitidis]KAJ4526353.1 hypothetical protein HRR74_001549 [Exophiala dermatitidis]KAJ4546447.1 hypothetical protein HRR77_004977 [Exophiala dermatitidis]KAJ4580580.1 hypothetical protein HRR82_004248 [Exophiala dermatitidis]KAJ4605580.1 hypothetical protein HRR83_001545 [Exophiala dermatitidis]